MYWLRSALLYLFLASLLAAGIWLFWGDTLRQRRNAVPALGPKTAPPSAPPRRVPIKPAQSGKEARQGITSALVALAQSLAQDNRQQLATATLLYEQRYRELLVNLGLKKKELPLPLPIPSPLPSVTPAVKSPVEKQNAANQSSSRAAQARPAAVRPP